MPSETEQSPPAAGLGAGLGFAFAAYGWWGGMPIFFLLLEPSGPIEIVAWRVVLTLVVCVVLMTVTNGWRRLVAVVRDPRSTVTLGIGGALICVNWLVYVYASVNGHVVEAAMGYFINPIVTVLLGVVVLREKLRALQWVSIAVSVVAVIVLVIGYGQFPWIAIVLALSFGSYGLVKKRVASNVDSLSGLAIETAWLAPIACIALIVIAATGGLTMGRLGGGHTALLLSAGVVTAVPLLLFASAARRLPLAYVGLTQYVTPILQFIIGVVFLHEAMPAARLVGFAIVWLALILLTVDLLRASRRPRAGGLELA
ncbi:EamA family transporter RarD [soil metagenome]